MNGSDWLWFCEGLDDDMLTISLRHSEWVYEDDEMRQSSGLWAALGTLLWRVLFPKMT